MARGRKPSTEPTQHLQHVLRLRVQVLKLATWRHQALEAKLPRNRATSQVGKERLGSQKVDAFWLEVFVGLEGLGPV